jgi:hypothetical protein
VVGRNLTIGGGGGTASQGRVTYGGTLTATGTLSTLGGLHQEQPPFAFPDQMATLRERSAQWADLTANGTIGGPGSYDIRFNGTSSTLDVFALTASALQTYGKITINVPPGSTALVNVSGSPFTPAGGCAATSRAWPAGSARRSSSTPSRPRAPAGARFRCGPRPALQTLRRRWGAIGSPSSRRPSPAAARARDRGRGRARRPPAAPPASSR